MRFRKPEVKVYGIGIENVLNAQQSLELICIPQSLQIKVSREENSYKQSDQIGANNSEKAHNDAKM